MEYNTEKYRIDCYKKNVAFAMINKLVTIFLPFVTRTCLIYVLGLEYVGLNGLFSSILQMLSLAELGFGSALVFSMYKPAAENDNVKLCALLRFYKKIYRMIGLIILSVGLVLLPFIRFLINGDCPSDVNIYILYLVYLSNTVVSYFLFGYKNSVLTVYQKSYISSLISSICYFISYFAQIIALILTRSFYIYVILTPLTTATINIITALFARKLYPNVECYGELEENEKNRIFSSVKALMWHKIGNTLIYSFDSIAISSFLGLVILGKYNNYYYVYNAIAGIFSLIYSSLTAGIGNSLILNDEKKIQEDFLGFTFLNMFAVNISASTLICVYQDFISVWIGRENLLPFSTVILMVTYFYVWHSRRIVHTYKDAAGLWKQDQFRPLSEGIANLVLNIIFVYFIGLNGIVIASIVSTVIIGVPWEVKIFVKDYCGMSLKEYFIIMLKYFVLEIIIGIALYFAFSFWTINGWIDLIFKGMCCFAASLVLNILIYHKKNEFQRVLRAFVRKNNP